MAITIDQKRLTKQSIFNYIYYSTEPVSKPQIATELNLSLPTVYKNITELLDDGLIVNAEIQKSTGGRPPVAYASNKDYGFAVSIAVTSARLRIYAADMWREEIGYKYVAINSIKLADIGEQIAKELPLFLEEHGLDSEKMLGLGITFPGVISAEGDAVLFSPTLDLYHADLSPMLEKISVSCPVIIDNDSNSASYVEYYSVPIQERDSTFIYLFLEYGVGGAIYLDGNPYYGQKRKSAEFGHMQVGSDGILCSCGKRDCLEAYFGAGRFSKKLGISIEQFMEEMKNGNQEYKKLWEDGLDHLAIALNSLHRNFDSDIVLGGFMTEYLEEYLPALAERVVKLDSFHEEVDYIRIGLSAKHAVVVGLANHILTQFLENI